MSILPKVDPEAIAQLHQNLLEDSRFNLNYLVLTVSSCLIATFGSEVLARSQPNLIDLGIAVVAGGLSGFAKVRPQVSDALAGTAIANYSLGN
jgi:uncharacterized membrane protein